MSLSESRLFASFWKSMMVLLEMKWGLYNLVLSINYCSFVYWWLFFRSSLNVNKLFEWWWISLKNSFVKSSTLNSYSLLVFMLSWLGSSNVSKWPVVRCACFSLDRLRLRLLVLSILFVLKWHIIAGLLNYSCNIISNWLVMSSMLLFSFWSLGLLLEENGLTLSSEED